MLPTSRNEVLMCCAADTQKLSAPSFRGRNAFSIGMGHIFVRLLSSQNEKKTINHTHNFFLGVHSVNRNWIWALIHVDVACVSSSCQNETVLIEAIVYLPPFILRHLSSRFKQWLYAVHLLNTFATANCCLFGWAHAKTKTKINQPNKAKL